MEPSNTYQSIVSSKCLDCDQLYPFAQVFCSVCGSTLTRNYRDSNNDDSENSNRINFGDRSRSEADFLDLVGEDMRQSIMESMSLSAPNRMVSKEYLTNISVVAVEERRVILTDSYLMIGPLKILTVMAAFGGELKPLKVSGSIVMGEPEYGQNEITNSSSCTGSIVCLRRGLVSFAQKAIIAQQSGAAALVVIQTGTNWPFVMTDSARELETKFASTNISIPVVMIGPDDGKIVEDMIKKLCGGSTNCLQACLKFGIDDLICAVCHEIYAVSDSVIKLPCRHLYHADCLKTWLQTNSTCPMCRHQLPSATREESVAASASRRQQQNNSNNSAALPYFR